MLMNRNIPSGMRLVNTTVKKAMKATIDRA